MTRKLYEYYSHDAAELLVESSGDGKSLVMSGLFIQGDVKNQNGRIYPTTEISRAVESIQKRLSTGETVMGELDHPEELQINLDRVSHMITEMEMQGSNGFGKLKLLNTPMGKIAETLLQSGAKLGVSSRGSGNVSNEGKVSEFDIVTVDIVAQPSAPDAYPKAIRESLFNMQGGGIIHDIATAVTHDKGAQKHLSREIVKFIRELNLK